ncbi:MAG TPA: T9SS type A sorting domain-containing protein [Bacteroidetes bacterium]|nr:T9SS type A sorting domain-containing protein [Bacteroidota bacterium]
MKNSIITFILFLIFSSNLHANTFYVATNGLDTSPGTAAQPWKTIQKAANLLLAGDTVLIKAGTYKERVTVQHSGNSNQYIVFSNYQNEVVTIDGDGLTWGNWNGLFDVSDQNYIVITGLGIKNSAFGGIWAEKSQHIIIRDNYTYNTKSSGIGVWDSKFITVENNEVELACNDGGQECITISNSSNCEIMRNHVHDNGPGTNGGEGIDVKEGTHDVKVFENLVHDLNARVGIYADAWDKHTYNIEIYRNKVHHCTNSGFAIASERGGLIENVTFSNNISFYNKWDGIELGGWKNGTYAGSTPVKHIKFINNTCYKNGAIGNGWGYGIVVDNVDAEDIVIRNNILSGNSAQIGLEKIKMGGQVDHNLIYGDNTAQDAVFGSDSILGDPKFLDLIAFNFRLQGNSPAIDVGDTLDAPAFDFANSIRPYGNGIDLGAYEYNSTLPAPDAAQPDPAIKLFPNPFSDELKIFLMGQKPGNYTIQLFTHSGKLVREIIWSGRKSQAIIMQRKNLNSGLYILNIQHGDENVFSKKLIIE